MNLHTKNKRLKETTIGYLWWVIRLVLIVALMAFSIVALLVWGYLQPKESLHCGSFGSYYEALNAYQHGAHYLDSDNDGVPCENLFKHHTYL